MKGEKQASVIRLSQTLISIKQNTSPIKAF